MGFPQYNKVANYSVSQATSDAVDLTPWNSTLCGFILPSTFAGTSVTFTMSDLLTGTYVPVCDEYGTALSYTCSANKYIRVKPVDFAGVRFLKVVSSTSEPLNEQIKLAIRPID